MFLNMRWRSSVDSSGAIVDDRLDAPTAYE